LKKNRAIKFNYMIIALLAVVLFAGHQTLAEAAQKTSSGVKVGLLSCKTIPGSGLNLIIHSTRDVTCSFESSAGAGSEHYRGEMGIALGIDLNISQNETIGFSVLTADFKAGTHQLAGKYVGAKASATVGVGAGAAVLLGGSNDSITLQPLAISGSTGVGAAAGIGYLYLEPGSK